MDDDGRQCCNSVFIHVLNTHKKSEFDDASRILHLLVTNFKLRNSINADRYHARILKKELAKRRLLDCNVQASTNEFKSEHESFSRLEPDGSNGLILTGLSPLSSATNAKPTRPLQQPYHRIRQNGYLESIQS